jgi:hypothetical protein
MTYLIVFVAGVLVGGGLVWHFDTEIAAFGRAAQVAITAVVLVVGVIAIGWLLWTHTSIGGPHPVACPTSKPAGHATAAPKGTPSCQPSKAPARRAASH